MDDRAGLGIAGEKHAVRFLRRMGYRLVTRNYRCAVGEIDIVALDGPVIVFVEVKTRSSRQHADPEDAVNAVKQARLSRAARFFLRQTRCEGRAARFDVLAITCEAGDCMNVEHFPHAFTAR